MMQLGNKQQILVVEDQPDNLLVLQAVLEHEGYGVCVAFNGEEALRILEDDPRRVGLILSDVMMPGLNGYELCRILRNDPRLADLPIVLITAKRIDETDALYGMNAGADDYLVRPIDSRLLVKKIQLLLERKQDIDHWQAEYLAKKEALDQQEWSTHMLVHDMRSPITGAMAAAGMLEMDPSLNSQQRLLVEKIQLCLENQNNMLQDILSTAAARNGQLLLNREVFDLGACVRQQLLPQEEEADFRRITFDCQGMDEAWRVTADRRLIGRVIANLLTNALKYANSKSTITIWIGSPAAAPYPVGGKDGVGFLIANDCPPIPVEYHEKIFEPFAQGPISAGHGSSRVAGVGLGLCFCKQIVDLHGGHLGVISPLPGRPGGASFYFTLP